jgi:hypothetical protein
MTMILKIIGQWDGKYLMMLQIKIIRAVLNVSTYIITSDAACPIILPVILMIMFIPTLYYNYQYI